MSIYAPERKWPRLVPANAVMASVYAGKVQAYGLIANISEDGTCVVSGVHFEPGSKILLRIGFDNEKPFSTEANVVWSRDETESNSQPTFVHGVKFVMISDEQRTELKMILGRPGFQPPVIPGKPSDRGSGFGDLVVDLSEDLDQLGAKVLGDDES